MYNEKPYAAMNGLGVLLGLIVVIGAGVWVAVQFFQGGNEPMGLVTILGVGVAAFLLSGLFWDAILTYGDSFERVVREDCFQQNLHQLLRSVLPTREGADE